MDTKPLASVRDLVKHFPIRSGWGIRPSGYVHAVNNINFDIFKGETLGLVGESGSGKSTTGQLLLGLLTPTSGKISFLGQEINAFNSKKMREIRKNIQVIFQDPYASLDPRMSIAQIIGEALDTAGIKNKSARLERIKELLDLVGLDESYVNRHPHEFSGGQRQRIGIARALAVNPQLIICDEPISSLDVSIQAQIINLLQSLQAERNLTYLFIAHDLNVVRHISNRVAVMYLGKIVELAKTEVLFSRPSHPYTQALLSAIPIPDPKISIQTPNLSGEIPSPINLPSGCFFHPRCPYVNQECKITIPETKKISDDHWCACLRYQDILISNPNES
jgi:oligopeptide transport system ATP-binding protein